jgi:hypothetical protein
LIYFIRPATEEPFRIGCCGTVKYRPIKIGSSNKPLARLCGLRSHYKRKDLELLGVIPGGILTEYSLHKKFDRLRVPTDACKTDWFRPAKRLLNFIDKKSNMFNKTDELTTALTLQVQDEFAMLVERAAFANQKTIAEFIIDCVLKNLKEDSDQVFPFRHFGNYSPINTDP